MAHESNHKTQPADVRVVMVGEDGAVQSYKGLSLADAGQKIKGEETILPRMFLSWEAERLIRSFNSDAVYSQPVRIQRPSLPPPCNGDGQERNARIAAVNRQLIENDPINTLNDMWRRDLEETSLPLAETQTLPSSAWRLSHTNRPSPPPQQTQKFTLPSPIMKLSPVRTGQGSFALDSPPFDNLLNSSPSNILPHNYCSPSKPITSAVSISPKASHTETFPLLMSPHESNTSSISPLEPIPPITAIGVTSPSVTCSRITTNSVKSIPFPVKGFSPLSLSQFPTQSPSSQQNDPAGLIKEFDDENYGPTEAIDVLTRENSEITTAKDIELDEFIESRLKEIVPDNEPAQTIKPMFHPPTKQSKLTNYYPSRSKLPSFKPPLKNGSEQDADKKLMEIKETVDNLEKQKNMDDHHDNAKNSKKLKMEEDEIIINENNIEDVEKILFGCKELVFLMVFREGFTQLRDTSALGTDFGSPMGVVVRVEGKEGDVKFIRVELWRKSCSVETRVFFWNFFLLHPSARKLVYDGKAFLISLLSVLPTSITVPLSLRLVDPIVGCWLLQPDNPVSSFSACMKIILPSTIISSPGSDNTASMHREMDLLSKLCRELFHNLEKLNLWGLFYQLEMRILPVLVAMERRGVCVERSRLEELSTILSKELGVLQEKANKIVGKEFNLSSPKQVRKVLYEDLKVDLAAGAVVGKTTGGVKSTCEAVLTKLVNFHPLPAIILQHRHVAKYKTTYVEGILAHCKKGKVFTTWDQVAAATGRITSVSPNLQALPKGVIKLDSITINLRSPFIPTKGFKFLAADFEQIEFRIFGHLSQDFHLLAAIKEGGDIFKKLAAIWLEKSIEMVTEDDRDKTKKVVYSLMYGAGKVRLSEILSITATQAATIISSFYTKFSSLRSFNQRVIAKAEKDGFLTTLFGRRRYFPHISSSTPALRAQGQRQAFNFLIQGSAADIVKSAVLRAEESMEVEGVKARLVMMIHDEMAWEVEEKDVIVAGEIIKNSLEGTKEVIGMDGKSRKLEMKAKISYGDDWGSLTVF